MNVQDYEYPERLPLTPESDYKKRNSWFEISFDDNNDNTRQKVNNLQVMNKPINAKLKVYKLINHNTQPPTPRNSVAGSYIPGESSSYSLPRSASMPVMNGEVNHIESPISNNSSRKSSLVSDCRHRNPMSSSCRASVVSANGLGIDSQDDGSKELSGCSRHHHRRGSVAIKFKKPEYVIGNEDNKGLPTNLQARMDRFELS